MVAVGIMAVFMTIGMSTLYRNMHQDSMRKAVSDVLEACNTARARAILDHTPMELRIRPGDRILSVAPAAGEGPLRAAQGFDENSPESVAHQFGDRMGDHSAPASPSGFSVTLSPSFLLEGVFVNGEDWTEDTEARVRFYPNGTSDELSIVLRSDKGERRNIWLEVVTGLPELEVDPLKFRGR